MTVMSCNPVIASCAAILPQFRDYKFRMADDAAKEEIIRQRELKLNQAATNMQRIARGFIARVRVQLMRCVRGGGVVRAHVHVASSPHVASSSSVTGPGMGVWLRSLTPEDVRTIDVPRTLLTRSFIKPAHCVLRMPFRCHPVVSMEQGKHG